MVMFRIFKFSLETIFSSSHSSWNFGRLCINLYLYDDPLLTSSYFCSSNFFLTVCLRVWFNDGWDMGFNTTSRWLIWRFKDSLCKSGCWSYYCYCYYSGLTPISFSRWSHTKIYTNFCLEITLWSDNDSCRNNSFDYGLCLLSTFFDPSDVTTRTCFNINLSESFDVNCWPILCLQS